MQLAHIDGARGQRGVLHRPGTWAPVAVVAWMMGVMAQSPVDPWGPVAERYVKLVLAIGQHDADYVDAFYGPEAWKTEAARRGRAMPALAEEAASLEREVAELVVPNATDPEVWTLRRQYLARQLSAARARLAMLQGARFTFDEESRALYDAVAPTHAEGEFDAVLTALAAKVPGDGPLIERYERYKQAFVIPENRLDRVFQEAIRACRERTLAFVPLPPSERFTVEYVTGKSWSGYNWYQGQYRSVIQVNTDLPVYIDRAVDLACHEGYPGHHVYNVLLEQHLTQGRGWVEYSVYPLFSPQSLIAEGTANAGIEIAFPQAERLAFEADVLFPLAGLDGSTARAYYEVLALVDRLSYAGNEAARRYLYGAIGRDEAAAWLERFALYARPRAEQRVRFIDQYRSYVINYNLGKDLVRAYVEAQAGPTATPADRWRAFTALLSSPRLPSGLQ